MNFHPDQRGEQDNAVGAVCVHKSVECFLSVLIHVAGCAYMYICGMYMSLPACW